MNTSEIGQSAFPRRAFLAGGVAVLGSVAAASTASASPVVRASRLNRQTQSAPQSFSAYSYMGAPGPALFAKVVRDYNKATGANLTITLNTLSGTGAPLYEAKIRSLISSGSQPAMFQNWIHSLAYPYIQEGLIAPTTSWFNKYHWDSILYKNAVNYVKYKGVPYGVPITVRGMPFWFRPSIFKKAGVGVPKTFAQFESAMASISKMGVAPIAVGEIYGWDLMRIFEYLLEVAVGPTVHDQLINGRLAGTFPAWLTPLPF
jgi:raffinose/stachyose/melibiose transport system substrate-binding protein